VDVSSDVRAPAGFIFHMSRCGSTLAARMLASLSRLTVISEAPPIDHVIQARRVQPAAGRDERIAWLRSIVASLGVSRSGETSYIVKLDSWHIHDLPLIRAAFPQTPWVFLYRNPVEVLVSQMRRPGKLALPGAMDPAILHMKPDQLGLSREEWTVRVLAQYCGAALRHRYDPNALFVDYRELPGAVWRRLCKHFSLALDENEILLMQHSARCDAKNPGAAFIPDSAQKALEATPEWAGLVDRFLRPVYTELEAA
jgi:hypothetical protein